MISSLKILCAACSRVLYFPSANHATAASPKSSELADEETKAHSRVVLEEIFTASEMCFIPNRMKLIVSQINERFGQEITEKLSNRLEYSLINVWGMDKKEAKELIAEFPCLWVVHIIQSYALFNQSLGV